jgi:hypothetical protein
MFGRGGLVGALIGAVVVGSVIGVTYPSVRRHYQANSLRPGVVPARPVRFRPATVNRTPQSAPPVAPRPRSDLAAQLQQLGQLYSAGVLSDVEFAQAKQKVLRG